MSQENVEIVRRGYESFKRGDLDAAVESHDDGLEGDMQFSQVVTFRRGKVVLAEYFWDHQEALKAAGLSE